MIRLMYRYRLGPRKALKVKRLLRMVERAERTEMLLRVSRTQRLEPHHLHY